jgi:glycosyltransferase involved in cell wall biosynthesis
LALFPISFTLSALAPVRFFWCDPTAEGNGGNRASSLFHHQDKAISQTNASQSSRRIALFIDRLTQGGVQHSFLGLAEAFRRKGLEVDLVVGERSRRFEHPIPEGVRLLFMHGGGPLAQAVQEVRVRLQSLPHSDWRQASTLPVRWRTFIPGLCRYLTAQKPDAMLSAKPLGNLTAILAKQRTGIKTRLVISERGHVSEAFERSPKSWKPRLLPGLMAELYPLADHIVAISNQVGDDLAANARLDRTRVETIYNALLRPEALDAPPADHPWFREEPPVILSAGRLDKAKDFPTLIRAFAKLRAGRKARLIIIGEGKEREKLEKLVASLGLGEDVALPGFQTNPFPFMKAADLFVLASTNEGFGNVLVEALASGCSIVSTSCPGGPSEILDGGVYGHLVPVADTDAMADAMAAALDSPTPPDRLRARAETFSMERTAARYLACLLPDDFSDVPAAAA